MRHRRDKVILSRTTAERKALARKLALSFFREGKIQTTAPRARFLRRFVEPLITKGKPNAIACRRAIAAALGNAAATKLVLDRSKKYEGRAGGYTRMIKLPWRRSGDAAPLVQVEFVE